jgi:uncharacterized protein YndB with AHSA1/START domain
MTKPFDERASTRVSRTIKAPRTAVYRACLDPDALASWRVPENMRGHMHTFDRSIGGAFRMTLAYQDPERSSDGKTSAGMDTFQGRFAELIADEKIVEVIEFEFHDSGFAGEMKITTTFVDADDGTEITVLCEGIPSGVLPQDNEVGTAQALEKLAALLE